MPALPELLNRIRQPSNWNDRQTGLEELKEQLQSEEEKGLFRAAALDAQADRLLIRRLEQIISRDNVSNNDNRGLGERESNLPPLSVADQDELKLTLDCLALIWTKSSTTERRNETRRQGVQVLPILLQVWARYPHQLDLARPILLILRSWAKMKDDSVHAALVQSGLVQQIRDVIQDLPEALAPALRADCFALMKHLVFRADDSNKEVMYDSWIGLMRRDGFSEDSAESSSACFWNWATSEKLGRRIASTRQDLESLSHYLVGPHRTQHVVVQRHAVSALGTVISLYTKDEGPLALRRQSWIVPTLIDMLQDTQDADSRRRCIRTIRCFSLSQWGRDFIQTNQSPTKPLIPLLLQLLRTQEDVSNQLQVCQTIVSFVPSFTPEWWAQLGPHMEVVLIQTIETSVDDRLVVAALQALQLALDLSPWRRAPNFLLPSFYQRLLRLVQTSSREQLQHTQQSQLKQSAIYETVAQFIHQLALQTNQSMDSTMFVNSAVLDVLCTMMSSSEADCEHARELAIHSLVLLTDDQQSRKTLAEHEDLLTAVVNFALVTTSNTAKDQAKQVILMLVPEL